MKKEDNLGIIYNFGKDVIVKARDMTIEQHINVIDGKSKAPLRVELHNRLKNFDTKQKELLKAIIVDTIDGAINNFLWMMEENNDKYALIAKRNDGSQFDIEQESDGLCMGQYEFIDQYSKYNEILDILETGKLEKEITNEQ